MHRAQTLALLLAAGLLCSGCGSGAISSNYRSAWIAHLRACA